MNWIKNNVFTTIVIVLFTIGVFVLAFISDSFFANSGNPVYGNRLDNIKTIEITQTNVNNLTNGLKDDKNVSDVKYELTGKIIKITITVVNDCSVKDAKKIGNKTLEYFDDEQKSNYDIEVYLIKANDSDKSFPIDGHKHSSKSSISWSKDR